MDVAGDSGAAGLADVETEVEAGGIVDGAQDGFHALSQQDHLLRVRGRKDGERVEMAVRDDEYVACVVREGVETEEAGGPANEEVGGFFCIFDGRAVGDGVVDGGDHVAEDTVAVLPAGFIGEPWPRVERGGDSGTGGVFGAADVLIAPRGPETIHGWKYTGRGRGRLWGEDFLSG